MIWLMLAITPARISCLMTSTGVTRKISASCLTLSELGISMGFPACAGGGAAAGVAPC